MKTPGESPASRSGGSHSARVVRYATHIRISRLIVAITLSLTVATTVYAAEPAATTDLPLLRGVLDKKLDVRVVDPPKPDFSADIEARKSYVIPALEIFGFDLLLNRFNRQGADGKTYAVNLSTINRNLRTSWVVDNDPFKINQLGHPYQGSMYHGFARSAGLNYWESLGYTFAGSVLWEIAGETTLPSKNDQIASGIGGSFLGEALFRMSSLV